MSNSIGTTTMGVLIAFTCVAATTHAQQRPQLPANYPNKPIRLLVGNAPGGGSDITARIVAQKITEQWNSPWVVDNRAGAGGIIAMDLTARATPDGYTLLVVSSSAVMNAAIVTKVPYDIRKAFAPISQLISQPYVLVVNQSLPVNSVRDLVSYAKSRPGALSYASAGTGSTAHLGMELFKSMAGVDMVHVPYKGIGPGIIDLLGGQIQLLFSSATAAIPHVKSGKLKALAVTSLKRSRFFPDWPTISETGVPGFDMSGWYGLVAPAHTPQVIVRAVNQAVDQILSLPDVQEKLARDGVEAAPGSPEELSRAIGGELDKWAKLMKETKLNL